MTFDQKLLENLNFLPKKMHEIFNIKMSLLKLNRKIMLHI